VDKKERPEVPIEEIIKVNNTIGIDFRKPYQFIYDQWWFHVMSIPVCFIIVILANLASLFFYGLKVIDRHKVKKLMRRKGCILVSNHCHYMDTVYASIILYPRRLNISVVQRNFEVPYIRHLLWLVKAFPIPASHSGLRMITKPVGKALKKGQHVLFLPEGNLVYLSQKIYRFKLGAFQQSYLHQAPVIPMVYVLKRRRLFRKELPRGFVKMIAVFGDPVMPPPLSDNNETPKEALEKIADSVADWMENTIQTYQSGFKRNHNRRR